MSIFASWSMGGLIKANLKVYFDSVKIGIDHNEALAVVLKSRYPFEPGKIREVSSLWRGAIRAEADYARFAKIEPPTEIDVERDELRDLILNMYYVETHLDITDTFKRREETIKFEDKFNELYDKMKAEYP